MSYRRKVCALVIGLMISSTIFATDPAPALVGHKPLARVRVKIEHSGDPHEYTNDRKRRDGSIRPNDPAWQLTKVTDDKGAFEFPPLAKGKYVLTLELPTLSEAGAGSADTAQSRPEVALVTIEMPHGKTAKVGWDFKLRGQYTTPSVMPNTRSRVDKPTPIIVESNGVDPIRGVCQSTVVRSKSNIANN